MLSAATIRWRRHQQRKRDGRVLLEIECDEIAVEQLLIRHGLLPSYGAHDQAELTRALGKLVERLIAANTDEHKG